MSWNEPRIKSQMTHRPTSNYLVNSFTCTQGWLSCWWISTVGIAINSAVCLAVHSGNRTTVATCTWNIITINSAVCLAVHSGNRTTVATCTWNIITINSAVCLAVHSGNRTTVATCTWNIITINSAVCLAVHSGNRTTVATCTWNIIRVNYYVTFFGYYNKINQKIILKIKFSHFSWNRQKIKSIQIIL